MPEPGYKKGRLSPAFIQDWSNRDRRVFWTDLRRPGDMYDYDALPVEPELMKNSGAAISCVTKYLGEDGFCGYVCRDYRLTCSSSGPKRKKAFPKWKEAVWKANPAVLRNWMRPELGFRTDVFDRTRPEAAWDRALIDAVNQEVFAKIKAEVEKRGCPTMCPIQMSAAEVHVQVGRLRERFVDPDTGKLTVEISVCMECWPLMGSQDTVPVSPEVRGGLEDSGTVYWSSRNPPCSQKSFKPVLTACVHLVSSKTMSKKKMVKKATAVLNAGVAAEARRRQARIRCVPWTDCRILWGAPRDYNKGYQGKRSGHPSSSGSTVVQCREYPAKCLQGGWDKQNKSNWESEQEWWHGKGSSGPGGAWSQAVPGGSASSGVERRLGEGPARERAVPPDPMTDQHPTVTGISRESHLSEPRRVT